VLENNINYILKSQLKILDEVQIYNLYYFLIKWSRTKNNIIKDHVNEKNKNK
jgi:hypothetical protein